MRTYFKILMCIPILAMVSCQDSEVDAYFVPSIEGHYIDISQNSLLFSSSGGDIAAQLTTNKSPWAFSDVPEWLSINPLSGDNSANITFTAEKNLSADITRTSVFYLMSTDDNWKYRYFMSAQQTAATPYLDLSSYSLQFKGSTGAECIGVSTNTKFQAMCTESWVHADISESYDIVEIMVEENLSGLSRTATVQLYGTINKAITVTQQAADLTGESTELHYTCDEGIKEIQFNSETAWSAATSSQWIEISPSEGTAGSNSIHISVTANTSQHERTDYVYIKIGTESKLQVPVRQDGVFIATDTESINFNANSSKQTLSISSNILWEIVSCPDWITPSLTSTKGNATIELTAEENPNTTDRNGVIKISQPGFSYAVEVIVTQKGMSLSSDVESITFDDKEQTSKIKLNTLGVWGVKSSVDWLTISPTSGNGNAEITITVNENKDSFERLGYITISVGNIDKVIKIVQTGKHFSYTTSNLSLSSTGGTINLSLVTNDEWEIAIPEIIDWISLDKNKGQGSLSVNINIKDNPSIQSRECNIRLIPNNLPEVEFPIIQSGRYLTVDHTQLNFFAKGGTSESIIIDTDGIVNISCNANWIHINRLTDKIFTVTVERSMLLDPREGVITLSLADLIAGEEYSISIKVNQKAVSEVFNGYDYDEDEDWN